VAREARGQEEILIKIDMQGYEEKVLLGGVDLIARTRLLIIEVSFKTLYERGFVLTRSTNKFVRRVQIHG